MHSPLPFPAPYWCVVPFSSASRPSGQHACSEQDVSHAFLHSPGEQPHFPPHATVADPEKGRLAGGQLHPAPSKVGACLHLLGNTSAAEKVPHLLKRIRRKRRMRFCYVCAHTVRQLCSTGSPGAQVWGTALC